MNTLSPQVWQEVRAIAATAPPGVLAEDESFWAKVRSEYATPAEFVHLEYGYYHPASRAVLAAEIGAMTSALSRGSYYKRTDMQADREAARVDLARVAGASAEEVVLTRNATEALNIAIQGIPLQAGDEIVHSDQDYPSVVEALQQRAQRDRLSLREAPVPLHPESDDEVVARFAGAITPRTRVMLITHLINFTGQILPVKKLSALARQHQLQVIVDAAHAFAHLAFTMRDIDCDYLGASLHKWLGAPLGTGLLYVRHERIAALQPFFGDTQIDPSNIRKLEHFGNRPDSAHIGLREAIRWHEIIGTRTKEARLRYLQRRWTEVARTLPRLRMLTPEGASRHGAIGAFAIAGLEPKEIVDRLMNRHGIFVNVFQHPIASGVRVTPGVPTSVDEIDQLTSALGNIASG